MRKGSRECDEEARRCVRQPQRQAGRESFGSHHCCYEVPCVLPENAKLHTLISFDHKSVFSQFWNQLKIQVKFEIARFRW